jgi:NADPH:quinone reductase-like Zn-dependent oxidoreductase
MSSDRGKRRGGAMKAVVHDRYGPPEVQRVDEVARPVPAEGEVLVRVVATTVTQTDCHMRRARPFFWRFMLGLRRPKRKTLGLEFAGVVEEAGSAVREFAVGDRVFGLRSGAHAEYVCVRESGLIAHMPDGATFTDAAAVCDGLSQAIGHLKVGRVGSATRLLVYGASGSCGTAAVQLGRQLGAHVTAVCNTRNVELVRSLGADEVIDYEREDFTKNGQTYDVILDAVGKHSFVRARGSLVPGGRFVATDRLYNIPLALLMSPLGTRKVVFTVQPHSRKDVLLVRDLLEAGSYRAVVDRTYPLEDVVAATHYVESWQKTGNVVLTLNGAS